MSLYERLVLESRKNFLRLTIAQEREILRIYKGAIDELAARAEAAKDKGLSKRWLDDYLERGLKPTEHRLARQLQRRIAENMAQAGKEAVKPDLRLLVGGAQKAGINLGAHFTQMFSRVPIAAIEGIVSGGIYKDGRGLSNRVWRATSAFGGDIRYVIGRGIAEKKSAYALARDLEAFILPSHRRPWDWGKVYPNLRTRQVDYNAQRLARTSITHSYRESQYMGAKRNPFVEGVRWELSDQHYVRQVKHFGRDECDDYAEQNDYGLGTGVFPVSEVPLSHPQCLCHTSPVVIKSLGEVADALAAWEPGNNAMLDEWYAGHGEYFATKIA